MSTAVCSRTDVVRSGRERICEGRKEPTAEEGTPEDEESVRTLTAFWKLPFKKMFSPARDRQLTTGLIILLALLQVLHAGPVLFYNWFGTYLIDSNSCCRHRLFHCCSLFGDVNQSNNAYKPALPTKVRPWPSFSNDDFTPEQLQELRKERRARRERFRDREMNRDTRRGKTK
ncbi:uncharacterized protein LOC143018139 isoform X2 [Oratosquilla oratoria]|uniref:uncharacterized protein LOC143018139 isoform X2 n=1 Tax=Oratosquilla oratoria TaxID=337810 RepID=UPI003F771820